MDRLNLSKSIPPADAQSRRSAKPIICYDVDCLPKFDMALYQNARKTMEKIAEVIVPPRDGATFEVPAGHFFRIVSIEGPQVGDLNLWNADDLSERFYSGKTRQLHASHVSTGDRLWSNLPGLRPISNYYTRYTRLVRLGMKTERVYMMLSVHDATLTPTIC